MKTCDMIEYVQSGTYANILESELDTDTEDMLGSKFNVLTAVSDIQVYSVNTDSELSLSFIFTLLSYVYLLFYYYYFHITQVT